MPSAGCSTQAARVVGGEIRWHGTPIGPIRERRTTRAAVAQIFQNPRASLNPIRTIGQQLRDVAGKDRVAACSKTCASMQTRPTTIRSSCRAANASVCGIALALGCEPELLVADEPTTGLDVTTEAAVMKLIGELSRTRGMATLLVTHNLAACRGPLPSHRRDACGPDRRKRAGRDAHQLRPASLFGATPRRHPPARGQARGPSRHSRAAARLCGDRFSPCRFATRCQRHAADCDDCSSAARAVGARHLVACRHPLC